MLGPLDAVQDQMEQGAGDDDGGEHADHHADRQRQGETLDDAGAEGAAEPEQDGARDQRRQVRIADRRPGPAETQIGRRRQVTAFAQLLPHAFEDQHVGVDRHPQWTR